MRHPAEDNDLAKSPLWHSGAPVDVVEHVFDVEPRENRDTAVRRVHGGENRQSTHLANGRYRTRWSSPNGRGGSVDGREQFVPCSLELGDRELGVGAITPASFRSSSTAYRSSVYSRRSASFMGNQGAPTVMLLILVLRKTPRWVAVDGPASAAASSFVFDFEKGSAIDVSGSRSDPISVEALLQTVPWQVCVARVTNVHRSPAAHDTPRPASTYHLSRAPPTRSFRLAQDDRVFRGRTLPCQMRFTQPDAPPFVSGLDDLSFRNRSHLDKRSGHLRR